jgi:hypothetical protein
MPDTGAPWNIPYVAASDLVKDWPTDNQTQAEAVADALDSVAAFRNVEYAVKTNQFSMTGTTPTLVTDLEVTITPTSTAAAIMVIAGVNLGNDNGSGQASYQIYANGTAIARYPDPNISGGNNARYSTQMFVHVPGATTAQNYEVRIWSPNNLGTVYVNWSSATTVTGGVNVQRSAIMAAEIVQ